MKSTLKIIVPFAILLGVIFGLTYIMQYTPTIEPINEGSGTADGGAKLKKPLEFASSEVGWNPHDVSPANRSFPGFFEAGTEYAVPFRFENPNPVPVTLQLKYVSCSACSEGGVAMIPPEALRQLSNMYGIGLLPFGYLPTSALTPVIGEAQFQTTMDAQPWQWKKFRDEPQATYEIPAASKDGKPQQGLLKLKFTARPPVEPRVLTSSFAAWMADKPQQMREYGFAIQFMVAPPFDVTPGEIDVGELSEASGPRNYNLMVVSSTRGPDQFPPPVVALLDASHAVLPGESFIALGKPVPLTESERDQLMEIQKRRIRAAYRIPITVTPKESEALDIGPLERFIWVTTKDGKEGEEKKIALRGSIKGSIWLSGGGVMELGLPRARDGITKEFKVVTDKTNVELEWDAEATQPSFLKVRLNKEPNEGDRGAYKVTVEVEPNQLFGPLPRTSVVVLKTKGPNPKRIRIPIKGSGVLN